METVLQGAVVFPLQEEETNCPTEVAVEEVMGEEEDIPLSHHLPTATPMGVGEEAVTQEAAEVVVADHQTATILGHQLPTVTCPPLLRRN